MSLKGMTAETRGKALRRRKVLSEARKPANRPECSERLAVLRREVPVMYRGLVEQIANGSRVAASRLHCLQCCGYLRTEVRDCTSLRCPEWFFRPYQTFAGDDADPETDDAGEA